MSEIINLFAKPPRQRDVCSFRYEGVLGKCGQPVGMKGVDRSVPPVFNYYKAKEGGKTLRDVSCSIIYDDLCYYHQKKRDLLINGSPRPFNPLWRVE